ncbi:MAG: class I SAM-dependent methyltransferase [Candidatus Edwardsbacteria bacterium]|jgi:2-polyprenyl-3-methyl-5-hydroxy-6-metoxy-1,4-benzoquinol methylase|nr:class I SAM-dependent methyltransferase [Candidatus Edwardsbacteria bacterium]
MSSKAARGNKLPVADVSLDRAILGLIKRTGARAVCDYGCGDGALLKRLDRMTGQRLQLTGIDYFSSRKKEDRPKGAGNLRFIDRVSREYRRVVEQGGVFDLIVSAFTLHHFRRPLEELAVLGRLLKPRGTLFLADLEFANDSGDQAAKNLFSFLSEEFHTFQGTYHRHHYTRDEALPLFAAAGLAVRSSRSLTVDFPGHERKEETGHALRNLDRMRVANRKTANAHQRRYFDARIEQMAALVKQHGIDYSRLFTVTAARRP